jgi:acyl carrier protein
MLASFWALSICAGQKSRGAKTMNEITLKIHEFIKDKLGVDESSITNTASFYYDLEVDSLDLCELMVDVEKEFNITIPDEQIDRLKTVGSLVNYVTKHVNQRVTGITGFSRPAEGRLSA